jgi:hypothetical protein
MGIDERAVLVYDLIWSYLIEHDRPPTLKQVAQALGWTPIEVLDSIVRLRQEEMLSLTSLNPVAYITWWQVMQLERGTILRAGRLRLTANGKLTKRTDG